MEKQDLFILICLPLAFVLVVWALGVGQCRQEGGVWRDCAAESYDNFGQDYLFQDTLEKLPSAPRP